MLREVRRAGDIGKATSDPAEKQDVDRLVRQIQEGSSPESSFRHLFERYCDPVTRFFASRGFSDAEAEDLAQECFLRVYKNMEGFRFEASFETWLFRIVGNVWKNALRERATAKRSAESVALDEILEDGAEQPRVAEIGDPTEGPLEQALSEERSRLLHQAFEALPPKMRRCMLLRIGQGLKYREIAEVLQVSMATVKTQLSEGYRRLRPQLEQHHEVFES